MTRKYDAADISVLSAMEGIRRAPGMYVGGTGAEGSLQCLAEVVQNSNDELRECGGGRMRVCISGDVVTVADAGRGIPVDIHAKTGKSAIETVLTHVHAGGKSGSKTAYGSRTFGVHGVGVSAVNALSSSFTAWSFRSGRWWRIDLSEGRVVERLRRADPPFAWPRGTIIRYSLDRRLMPEPIPARSARQYLNILRHFDPVDVEYTDDAGSVRMRPRQPRLLLDRKIEQSGATVLLGPVDFNLGGVRAVLAWTTSPDVGVHAHVSGSPVLHGTHVQGLEEAVTEAFASVRTRGVKDPDARLGMVALLDVSVDCPSFSGQVKSTLRTPSARRQVKEALLAPLQRYLRKNKSGVASVFEHASKIGAIESKSRELKELARAVKGPQTRLSFPEGFVGAFSFPAERRELYIVEGRSASGSGEFAKMPWQELLPLSGKMANVITKRGALSADGRVAGILRCVGYDPGGDGKKLRVSRVILLPDADDDGDHISVLLMTIFQRAMPRLMAEGRLFVCDAPLFEATDLRGQKVLGDRLQDMERRHGKLRNVSRMKGWGGCPVPLLRTVAFDPATRKLLRVAPPTAEEVRGLVSLMGADSAGRKALLEESHSER